MSLETISNSVVMSDRARSWFATETLVIRPTSAVVRDSGYDVMKETRYMITAELHGGWKCVFADNLFNEKVLVYDLPRFALAMVALHFS